MLTRLLTDRELIQNPIPGRDIYMSLGGRNQEDIKVNYRSSHSTVTTVIIYMKIIDFNQNCAFHSLM